MEAVWTTLGIETKISCSSDYEFAAGRNEQLVRLCRQAGAARYLSGPSCSKVG
jgi:WbqC-like protein family